MYRTLATTPSGSRLAQLLGLLAAAFVTSTASAQVTNLALAGTATQSTNYSASSGLAPVGIDGSTNGVYTNGSVTHTANQSNSWWQVDLGTVYSLQTLRIFNRSDCCGTRLSNLWVTVQNATVEVFRQDFFLGTGSVAQGGMLEIQLPLGTSGDAVAIGFYGFNNDGNGYLSIAEFEVLGGAIGTNYCISVLNSTGSASTISASGSASISANDLVLTANNLPSQPGIFIAGPTQAQVPFYNGFLCIDSQGLQLFQSVAAPVGGSITETVDYTTAAPGGLNVVAGSSFNYQRWNRDPAGGAGNANFSDGLQVIHIP